MKAFVFILGKANKSRANGVNQVIAGLCKYMNAHGVELRVIGLASNVTCEGESIQRDGFCVEAYSSWNSKLFGAVTGALSWCDICHIHGVYNFSSILVGWLSRRVGKPYVVSSHDGFAPERAKFSKTVFDLILQKRHLAKAEALHVLTLEESTEILEKINAKSFILSPNGIDQDDFSNSSKAQSKIVVEVGGAIKIGYLGRISKEKNLANLVKALELLKGRFDVTLFLAGPASDYLGALEKQAGFDNVEFLGPLFDEDKVRFLKSLDLFVHPSKADVFSIAAMEVMAVGTPLLITRTAKAAYFYNRNAFFMCEPTAYGIAEGISQAIENQNQWGHVVSNGYQLTEDVFNWNIASKTLIEGYKKLL